MLYDKKKPSEIFNNLFVINLLMLVNISQTVKNIICDYSKLIKFQTRINKKCITLLSCTKLIMIH